MKELLKNYLSRIAVLKTDNRYMAIIDILDELGVEYRIQEKESTLFHGLSDYSNLSFSQLSLFDNDDDDDKIVLNDERYEIRESDIYEDKYIILDNYSADGVYMENDEIVYFDDLDEALNYADLLNNFNEESASLLNSDDIDEYDLISKMVKLEGLNPISKDDYEDKYIKEKNNDDNIISSFNNSSTKNIIVSFNKNSSNKLVFMAHYDAVAGSTAANDNGSSVAILLCLIKYLLETGTDKYIEFVFVDKEEVGGYGCSYYIEEHGNNISEVINLDTCGVGTKIVLNDFSRHISDDTKILIDEKTIEKYNVVLTDMLPYCDTNKLIKKYDTLTICTFPDEDIPLISSIKFFGDDKKISIWEKEEQSAILSMYSRILSSKFFKTEVYKYMHNGERDSIEWINYDVMFNIFEYLKNLF